MFVVLLISFLGKAMCCPIPNDSTCCTVMTAAGIDVDTFNMSVAHGIHSITVEDLNYYFDAAVSEQNGILL